MDHKAPDAFRTISEVADSLDVPQHVLRFWETRFAQIKPMKRSGGRRYYRREDVLLLRGIRHLLYGEGYTIRGVQRILREQGVRAVQGWDIGGLAAETDRSGGDDHQDHLGAEQSSLADGAFDHDDADRDGPDAEAYDAITVVPTRGEAAPQLTPDEPATASTSLAAKPPEATGPPDSARAPEVIIVNKINDENVGLLRGALNDLLECRRLLDRAVGEH